MFFKEDCSKSVFISSLKKNSTFIKKRKSGQICPIYLSLVYYSGVSKKKTTNKGTQSKHTHKQKAQTTREQL